jgi:hypothetical protein
MIIKSNIDYDNNNLYIHLCLENDDKEQAYQFIRINHDEDGNYSVEENKRIIDFGDNYISFSDLTYDKYMFIYDNNDGNGFKIYEQDLETGDLTEIGSVDIPEYDDVGTEHKLISSIRIDDYLYTYAKDIVCKINLSDTTDIVKTTIPRNNLKNIKLIHSKGNDTMLIVGGIDLNNMMVISEYNLKNNHLEREIETALSTTVSGCIVTGDNELVVVSATDTGHNVYKLM